MLMRRREEEKKSLNIFKFGICIGCFSSDDVTSMAVKGLNAS